MREEMLLHGMISPEDLELFHRTDDVEEAAAEIERFYRVYHSQRYVRGSLVVRVRRPLAAAALDDLNTRFRDILSGPATQAPGPVPGEADELPELPRLVVPFNRSDYSRLRALLDFVNESA